MLANAPSFAETKTQMRVLPRVESNDASCGKGSGRPITAVHRTHKRFSGCIAANRH